MSMPATLGWVIVRAARDLAGLRLTFRLRWAIAFSISQLEKMAPHRVRRLVHSLKRDSGPTATNRNADSPISMTSPRTTLTLGHYAPLSNRYSAVPCPTLPQRSTSVSSARFAATGPITSLIPHWTRLKLFECRINSVKYSTYSQGALDSAIRNFNIYP